MNKKQRKTSSPEVTPVDLMCFAQNTSSFLEDKMANRKNFNDLEHFPIIPGKQAIYVMDWQKNQVTYQRNILELLGYSHKEFDDSIIHTKIHPNDINVVSRVIKGIVNHYVHLDATSVNSYLNICYRITKKDGTYIKVLRQSGVYEVMNNGAMISNWSLLTAIDFISNNNQIEWEANSNEVDQDDFKQKVYKEFQDFFSVRELLIIQGIKKGHKSAEIANQMHISMHTVHTHRKNILRKCNCSNKEQLLAFCKRNGVL